LNPVVRGWMVTVTWSIRVSSLKSGPTALPLTGIEEAQ
jgi:hypothetical protein